MNRTANPTTDKTAAGSSFFTSDVQSLWLRELFLFFYCFMAGTTLLAKAFPGFAPGLLLAKVAEITCAAGMIFAAGWLMSAQDSSAPDFKRRTLKKALFCILLFYGIGLFNERFINHRAIFATIKDLLALLRVPGVVSILLSLSFLFLLCAFVWPYMEKLLRRPALCVLFCAVGFLFSFMPFGLLGYSFLGVFIGGDIYACVPLIPYLFVFFTGVYCGNTSNAAGIFSVTDDAPLKPLQKYMVSLFRKLFLPTLFLAASGGVLAMLHQNQAAKILLGSAAAHYLLLLCAGLLPAYQRIEEIALDLLARSQALCSRIGARKNSSRALELFLYFFGYTILFLAVSLFVFAPYLQENRSLIWSVDGLGQYMPKVHRFLSYVPSVFHDLLHGNLNFQQYDFTSGLGATVSISYDPVYWLYLLFSPAKAETAYSLLIVLRYYLAGASMSALLLYFKKSPYVTWTCSIAYAFSGYAIYAGTRHGQFLTPLILLPILVIAMEKLVSEKKWYLLTIFTAISLLCSYYFLYMNTIALGIYFVTRILCTKEYRNFKTFFTRGLTIVGSYVLGASIGVISLFTSFGSYMGSSRTDGGGLSDFLSTTPLFYRAGWPTDFFVSFLSDSFSPGMWLKLGFAPSAFLAIVLLFTRRKQNKKELLPIFLIFSFFCFFPIFGYIFSGFSSVTNRWCYIYAIVVTFVLAENMEGFLRLTASELKIMLGILAYYAGILFFSTRYRTDNVFGAFGLLALMVILLLVLNHDALRISARKAKGAIFFLTVFSVVINANLFMTAGDHMETYVEKGTSMSRMSRTALRYLDKAIAKQGEPEKEEDFYRSTNLKTYGDTRCSSLIYGYNDLSTFTSTLGGSIVDYNRAMGNVDWNIVSIYSYNFRTFMHELASVRYIGTASDVKLPLPYGYQKIYDKETKNRTYSIYENQYALPLGYTYDTIFSEKEAAGMSAAEKQEATMLSAIVEDDALEKNSNIRQVDALPLTVKKIPVSKMKTTGDVTMEKGKITIGENGGTLKIFFKGEENAETYLSFRGDIYHPKDAAEHFIPTKIKADDVNYKYRFRIDSYSTGQEEYLFHLGYREDALSSCTLKFESKGFLLFDEINIYSQPMDSYPQRALALRQESLENVKTENNTVTGEITVSGDKMLVLSLPYQRGWTAWVDGEEVEIQKVNYQYMGLNLTSGHHKIRLHYQLPGIRYAGMITLGGLLTFLAIVLVQSTRKRRHRKER
ncbi:MAG: YfhO family protein [Eubacteriales bacterium]|nr:YfhO family protein [Eubacteriales bacterium]